MTVETDPVPPVPEHSPPLREDEIRPSNGKLVSQPWARWFTSLREKINVINDSLVNLLGVTGIGFIAKNGAAWAARTFQGPMSVVITNPDGAAGDPSFALVNDELTPGNMESYATDMTGTKGWYKPALFESTGLLTGGTLSINAGDNTKFDISQALVGFVDYTVNAAAPTRVVLLVGPTLAVATPSLAVIATYVGIDMPAGTIIQQSTPFTATQSRTIVPLGAVISNGVNLIAVNNLPNVIRAGISQIQDLMRAIGPMNISGNVISSNGANLQINKSAGAMFKQGANFANNDFDPHELALALLTASNFNYRLSNGTQFATTNSIDPNNYEAPLGTLTAVPAANRFTIQRISVFTSNLVRIQYGQFVYNTMAEAEASLATESFVTEANIAENGLLLCFLIVQDGATDLSDDSQAKFIAASKFGGPVGSGGTSITNTDALPEGIVNLYFTDARARAAAVQDTIVNGVTTIAPSQNAVFDALALKADLASPTFTGDPKAPTPLTADNDTSIATTAFVKAQGYTTNVGTVTSVAVANATGITWTGSPITGSGTLTPTLSTNLQAWSGIATSSKQGSSTTLTAIATNDGLLSGNELFVITGPLAVTVTGFAANTFVARGSTGNLTAKSITDTALAALANMASGTFTPTVIGSTTAGVGTYTVQNGTYIRMGNVVHFRLSVGISAHTGTGNIRIGGLPFTSEAQNSPVSVGLFSNLLVGTNQALMADVFASSTQVRLLAGGTGGGPVGSVGIPMDVAFDVQVAGTYFTA